MVGFYEIEKREEEESKSSALTMCIKANISSSVYSRFQGFVILVFLIVAFLAQN